MVACLRCSYLRGFCWGLESETLRWYIFELTALAMANPSSDCRRQLPSPFCKIHFKTAKGSACRCFNDAILGGRSTVSISPSACVSRTPLMSYAYAHDNSLFVAYTRTTSRSYLSLLLALPPHIQSAHLRSDIIHRIPHPQVSYGYPPGYPSPTIRLFLPRLFLLVLNPP